MRPRFIVIFSVRCGSSGGLRYRAAWSGSRDTPATDPVPKGCLVITDSHRTAVAAAVEAVQAYPDAIVYFNGRPMALANPPDMEGGGEIFG